VTRPSGSSPLPDARGLRVALVVSRYHHDVTDRLRNGARAALSEAGADDAAVEALAVPGTFEVPLAARQAAETGRFDAVVCLGCVVKGETPHFEFIASAVAHGITAASAETGIPMAFGVLTTNTLEEALARAGDGPSNKGWEAAVAAIELALVCRRLLRGDPTGAGG
jgi:6,7-dimethyl-8-ribityllumazine synthase|tara:strand:+ start:1220 stop:1720 length:501 start_codon:yes stop_codon:yes gene_type:complete